MLTDIAVLVQLIHVYAHKHQAAGGHNVIWGVHDYLKGSGSTVLGFVGGARGLFDQQYVEITDTLLASYKNQG
jgi:6-phosphofructokinase